MEGDLIPIDEWVKGVKEEYFTDYGGYGCLLDDNLNIIKEYYYPSDYKEEDLENVEYILWYNR